MEPTHTICTGDILTRLQTRLNGISDYIFKIEQELIELEVDATSNIELVNQRCDRVLQIINDYRHSLLNRIGKLKIRRKQQLHTKLNAFKRMHKTAEETTQKCQRYVSAMPRNDLMSYGLVYLHKIISAGNKREQLQHKTNNISEANRKNKSMKRTINIDFKQLMETQLNMKMHLDGSHIQFENDNITVTIPDTIKHRIVIESWRRKYDNTQLLPFDVVNVINAFSSCALNDSFDNKLIAVAKGKMECGTVVIETVFGSVSVSPGCVYLWTVKIRKLGSAGIFGGVNIGIIESEKCDEYLNGAWHLTEIGYAYFSGDGNFYHKDSATFGAHKLYGERYEEGDVIQVRLDLKANTIAFGKNNHFYYDQNVKGNTRYRLAIGTSSTNLSQICVQLLSSEIYL